MLWADDWTDETRARIKQAMAEHWAEIQRGPKTWARAVSPDRVYDFVVSGQLPCVMIEGYLLMFNIHEPWYAEPGTRVFNEQLVLRVAEKPGSFIRFIRGMETIAAANGCSGIAVGTALHACDARLGRIYERKGFLPQATALFKEMQ